MPRCLLARLGEGWGGCTEGCTKAGFAPLWVTEEQWRQVIPSKDGWVQVLVAYCLFFKIKNKPTLFCIPWAVVLYPGAGWSRQEHGMDPGISSECKDSTKRATESTWRDDQWPSTGNLKELKTKCGSLLHHQP